MVEGVCDSGDAEERTSTGVELLSGERRERESFFLPSGSGNLQSLKNIQALSA